MSPNTDEYWVGAFSMSVVLARSWLIQGRIDEALRTLDDVLTRFGESSIFASDPQLQRELSEYWEPKGTTNDDDSHVLRSLR